MSRRCVIKWIQSAGPYPFLKVVRRFSEKKRKTVPFIEWESSPATATQYVSTEAAMNEWERLGYAKAEYVEVVPV